MPGRIAPPNSASSTSSAGRTAHTNWQPNASRNQASISSCSNTGTATENRRTPHSAAAAAKQSRSASGTSAAQPPKPTRRDIALHLARDVRDELAAADRDDARLRHVGGEVLDLGQERLRRALAGEALGKQTSAVCAVFVGESGGLERQHRRLTIPSVAAMPKTLTGAELDLDDAPARDCDLFLVDGNNLAYRAFFALPEELVTTDGQPTNALLGFTNMLFKLLADYRPKGVAVAWDSRPVHRAAVAEAADVVYKEGRRPMPDLLREQFPHFRPIVEAFGYRNLEFEGWEADDVIATLATQADAAGSRRASSRPTATPFSSARRTSA